MEAFKDVDRERENDGDAKECDDVKIAPRQIVETEGKRR